MIRDELASIDAPIAPPVAERPPPTASRLTDNTATSRPVTAGPSGRAATTAAQEEASSSAEGGTGEYAAPIEAIANSAQREQVRANIHAHTPPGSSYPHHSPHFHLSISSFIFSGIRVGNEYALFSVCAVP
eukprot:COSAG05_NODE_2326_length_3231_cov_38.996096_6_plen_131_part_00